jgi:hypothetical protein
MSDISISRILKNIYGEESTQSFEKLSKRFTPVEHKQPKLLFVDETPDTNKQASKYAEAEDPTDEVGGLTGGGHRSKKRKTKGGKAEEAPMIYSSPMYVEADDLLRFIRTFNLAYTMVNSRRSAIYVIPESKILNSMINDFKKDLEKEGIKPGTIEVAKFISTNDFPFKRYIFDWKDKATPDDAYHIPGNFPNESTSIPLNRLNRCNEIFYFEFIDLRNIKISDSTDFSKANKLEFVAVCMNNVYILRGTVPECKERRKAITANVKRDKKSATKSAFVNLIDKYEGDLNRAGYEFIGMAALNKMKSAPKASVINDLVKYYSGNMGHAAFEILASHQYDDYFDEMYQDEELFEVHSDLLNKYTPVPNKGNINKYSEAIQAAYENSTKGKHDKRGRDINKNFFDNLGILYKNYSPNTMKADIACAYYQQHPTVEAAEYAVDLLELNERDDEDSSSKLMSYENSLINEDDDSANVYTPLINNVYSSIVRTPFIGPIAKSNIPLLPTTCYRKKGRMSGGSGNKNPPNTETKTKDGDNTGNSKDDADDNNVEPNMETFEDNYFKKDSRKKNKKKKAMSPPPSLKDNEEEEANADADLDVDKGFSIDFFK